MTIREILERRLEPQEQARIAAGDPFRFMQVSCDEEGCSSVEQVTEKNYDLLAEKVKNWFISAESGGPDYCPKCVP